MAGMLRGFTGRRFAASCRRAPHGSIPKFVQTVSSISFSARNAIENGQKVLYVTERCVFILTARGLKLLEVYPGVDVQKDILDLLPFDIEP